MKDAPIRMSEKQLEPMEYQTLSVIVPVYNESATVGEIIRRVRATSVPRAEQGQGRRDTDRSRTCSR
jgi:hypothetical protein